MSEMKVIKIKCHSCRKKIKIIIEFGENYKYISCDNRKCPYCYHGFGIISMYVKNGVNHE